MTTKTKEEVFPANPKALRPGTRLRYVGRGPSTNALVVLKERKADGSGWWLEDNMGGLADWVIAKSRDWVLTQPVPEPPEALIEAVAVWLTDSDHERYGGSYAFPRETARKILREAVS